jgi:hypothetical protein
VGQKICGLLSHALWALCFFIIIEVLAGPDYVLGYVKFFFLCLPLLGFV